MNTILQKRIRNSAIKYLEKTQGKEFNSVSEEQCLRVYAFEDGVIWALKNQWISTSESLPPLDEVSSNGSIGVIARTSEGVIIYAYYHHYLKQWFSAETSTRIDNVTKWMFVPEEGGEE